jgi:ADP-ribosylglycohydrolase
MKLYDTYKEQKLNKYYINKMNLSSLANLKDIEYIAENNLTDEKFNDSMSIIRSIPFGLMYYKKEDRKTLIQEIVNNIRLTHNNYTCIFGAIGLGLFLSYSRNGIPEQKWGYQLTDYLLSKEFDDIMKELKLYDTDFVIAKEDYITLWKEYLFNTFKKDGTFYYKQGLSYDPIYRNNYWYNTFTNENEFVYGIGADDSLIIAYNSLLYSNENWQNMILQGVLGITDNSVMGMICGALYGCQYKFENVWINKYVNEDWVKKSIKLGKSLGI